MNTERQKSTFVPALRYSWLTPIYDYLLQLTMAEQRIKEGIVRCFDVTSLTNMLDFGCGSATLTVMLKKACPDAQVTGIDVDSQTLEIAKRKAENEIKLICYDGEHLPLAAGTVDAISSCLVFHHIETKQKISLLKQLQIALRPGGELVIADFGRATQWLWRVLFLQIRMLDGFKPTAANADGELPLLISEAGFDKICITNCFKILFGEVQIIKGIKN